MKRRRRRMQIILLLRQDWPNWLVYSIIFTYNTDNILPQEIKSFVSVAIFFQTPLSFYQREQLHQLIQFTWISITSGALLVLSTPWSTYFIYFVWDNMHPQHENLGRFIMNYNLNPNLTNGGLSTNGSHNHNNNLPHQIKTVRHRHHGPPKQLASRGSKIRGEYDRHTSHDDAWSSQHGDAIFLSLNN